MFLVKPFVGIHQLILRLEGEGIGVSVAGLVGVRIISRYTRCGLRQELIRLVRRKSHGNISAIGEMFRCIVSGTNGNLLFLGVKFAETLVCHDDGMEVFRTRESSLEFF